MNDSIAFEPYDVLNGVTKFAENRLVVAAQHESELSDRRRGAIEAGRHVRYIMRWRIRVRLFMPRL
jgi:hypothetical protein